MDRKIFFEHIRRSLFGGALTQSQVSGINAILDEWDRRKKLPAPSQPFGRPVSRAMWMPVEWLAYMLATVYWECARKMQPISEFGGPGKRYAPYYGRGFVQLTWKANYEKAGRKVGTDLVGHPERALEIGIATTILFDGMIEGWFTGKKLGDYIVDAGHCDYVGARKIINGTDKALTIAGFAGKFEAAIEAAQTGQAVQPDMPVDDTHPIEQPKSKPNPSAPGGAAVTAGAGVIVAGGAAAATSGHPWLWIGIVAAIIVTGAIGFFIIRSRVVR